MHLIHDITARRGARLRRVEADLNRGIVRAQILGVQRALAMVAHGPSPMNRVAIENHLH